MLGCACRREHLKRRSMARLWRASSSMSASSSRVAETLRFLRGGVSDRRLGLAAHRFQIQLLQFLFEGSHRIPFRIRG